MPRPSLNEGGDGEARTPQRRAAPQAASSTKIYIYAGVTAALVLFIVIGYVPLRRMLTVRTLDSASTLDERRDAARTLVARHDGSAYGIFAPRLKGKDALARDASAYGMALLAGEFNSPGIAAAEELSGALKGTDDAGKIALAPLLGELAEKASEKIKSSKEKEGGEANGLHLCMDVIAKGLLPEMSNPAPQVRAAVAEALGKVRAAGVCAALLNAVENDADAGVKSKALDGIPNTALPDAVGALLKAVNSKNSELAKTAKNAFARVRDEAKSADLLPALDDSHDNVRLEIVSALGRRKGDYKAAEALTKALKDSALEVRKAALKGLPVTGLNGSALQLLPHFSDADEGVRVAAAQALGEMHDADAHKAVLQAFATSPAGKTLEALIAALQKQNSTKDIDSIAAVMEQLGKHPESFKSLSEALVTLTNAQQGAKRDAERRQWTPERWNQWWANISAREKLKAEALALLQKADARKQESKKNYPELLKQTIAGLEMLEKCQAMCQPDDPEDVKDFDKLLFTYQRNKDLFFKHQELDRGTL